MVVYGLIVMDSGSGGLTGNEAVIMAGEENASSGESVRVDPGS